MPSYVDFNASKRFRDFVLAKTLTVPNGPQTFTDANYLVKSTNSFANIDPGDVEDTRQPELLKSQNVNTYKPTEYFVTEGLSNLTRKVNLQLYPYFVDVGYVSYISVFANDDYSEASELVKFAAWNIKENPQGPVFSRIQQNLYSATYGRVRLIDALEGNLATALNLVTGREPLVESNPRITVASTLPGKGIDFLQTVGGVEFPWAEIPGDYLSNPKNPIGGNVRPEAATEAGRFFQDATGVLGSLLGIQRRPTTTRKPSDLFIEYMGQRQKQTLYDNLSYSKYAPDYTTTARSQNTSKIFNFVDRTAQSVRNFLGTEAPKGVSYIGDDRGNDVKYAMNDFNDRPVRSSYYLTMMFDSVQATLFQRTKNIGEGGGSSGKLTWISSKSKNMPQSTESRVGVVSDKGESSVSYRRTQNNAQYTESLSTVHDFRDDSILGLTQEILETMPSDGGAARSHVANVIDQTSRIFRDGDVMLSRGSAIKYVDQYTGKESGVEYCRVWTKDKSYLNYSDTMKKSGNYRKFESSVLNNAWNLNIYPNSNAKGEFDTSSTNMGQREGGFFAKKYMFSIENLAWKTSDTPGFTYTDLPYCERGPNGGRIMWFPPYGLKVTEQNNAKWEDNVFLGRPEPIYTYSNTSRSGQVTFKVIVDHPSILNLLVKKHFEGMSDAEADNYINAFFAGCQDVDFYGLVRKYTTLTPDEVKALMAYLNENKDTQPVTKNKKILVEPVPDKPAPENESEPLGFNTNLYFENRSPEKEDNTNELYSKIYYSGTYAGYGTNQEAIFNDLNRGLYILTDSGQTPTWGADQINDYGLLTGIPNQATRPTDTEVTALINKANLDLTTAFSTAAINYQIYADNTMGIKSLLEDGKIKNLYIKVGSSTSSVDTANNNLKLSYRRSYSVLSDFIFRLCTHFADDPANNVTTFHYNKLDQYNAIIDKYLTWSVPVTDADTSTVEPKIIIPLKEMGYPQEGNLVIDDTYNFGETVGSKNTSISDVTNVSCTDSAGFKTSDEFKRSAPSTFYCRSTRVVVDYDRTDGNTDASEDVKEAAVTPTERNLVEVNEDSPNGYKLAPPIDEIKKMIMKTLSECYYFKKLEEDSPLQFSSLKDKLKYFHPAFHSMTPEGLNARLTFLNQCVRPGDTLPVKGLSDERDLNARNTTFGPPPICVMRIGDFYHSKIIIRDVNIDFEENIWDLNPEGIGVQPMIANVTLQINFIGGHGLEKPVERLQNALSSNFYANTEVYDPRATATEDRSEFYKKTFTKEFLDDLNRRSGVPVADNSKDTFADKVIEGAYIGVPGNSLEYTKYIDSSNESVFYLTESYFNMYQSIYNTVVKTYGLKLADMILGTTYRSIYEYNVQTGGSPTTIKLLGKYPKGYELERLSSDFKVVISGKTASENITTLMGLNIDMTPAIAASSELILNPYVLQTVIDIVTDIPTNTASLKVLETRRNQLITSLDKLNFIIEYGYDGKKEKEIYTGVNITGFTAGSFYSVYDNLVPFIQQNQDKFTEDLDTSYSFYGITMTSQDLSYFLKVLLRDKKQEILNLYTKDPIFTSRVQKNIEKRLDKFFPSEPEDKDFQIPKYPGRKNSNRFLYQTADEFNITDLTIQQKLYNVHRTQGNPATSILNYHRPIYGTSG